MMLYVKNTKELVHSLDTDNNVFSIVAGDFKEIVSNNIYIYIYIYILLRSG